MPCCSARRTISARRSSARGETRTAVTRFARSASTPGLMPWMRKGLEDGSEGRRPFAAAENFRKTRVRRQLRAAIDRRHGEIELGSFSPARQHHADWMKERLTLLTRPRLHTVRDLAEF